MPPKRKFVTRKVKEDQNGSVNEDLADIEVREEHSDDIEAKATTPELVDSGNDSEIGGGGGIISSEEEEDEAAVALKDSDDEEDGALKLPAGTAYDDDVPERPPPNKKHTCLQSEILTSRQISGADACSAGKPAVLPIQKVKLHYVVHYLHRGTFDHVIPELQGKERERVDAYVCNICQKPFRNNVQRNEYPGRGSFICHLATEHGKILDVMREDADVDMRSVIELLTMYDKQFREFTVTGTKTDMDGNLVGVKESPYWRLLNKDGEKKVEEDAPQSSPQSEETGRTTITDEASINTNINSINNIPNVGVSSEKAVSDRTQNTQHGSATVLPTDPMTKNLSKEAHVKVGQSRKKKGSKKKSMEDFSEDSLTSGSDTCDDDGEASGEDSDDDDSGKDQLRPLSGQANKQANGQANKQANGQANASYVRKRRRGKIDLDSGGDESDEWDDGKKGRKKRRKGKRGSLLGDDDSVTVIMSKPPKRTSVAKVVVKEEPDWLSDEGEF